MTTNPSTSPDTLFKKMGYMATNAIQQLGMEKKGIKDEAPSFDTIAQEDIPDTTGYAFEDNTQLFFVVKDDRLAIIMPEITLLFINTGDTLTQTVASPDGKAQIAKKHNPDMTQDELVDLLHKGFQQGAFMAFANESVVKQEKLVNG